MSSEDRQRLNVRAIRVTLASALVHATPVQAELSRARARQLLAHAREEAAGRAVLAEIDALEGELGGSSAQADERES